jgi:hypothetical protein
MDVSNEKQEEEEEEKKLVWYLRRDYDLAPIIFNIKE